MDLPSLTTVCLGGERSPQPLLDQWAAKLQLLNTYGTTECGLTEKVAQRVFLHFFVFLTICNV